MEGRPQFPTGQKDILKLSGPEAPWSSSQQKVAVQWLQELRVEEGRTSAVSCVIQISGAAHYVVVWVLPVKDQGVAASKDKQEEQH